mmetsp:Transcript_71446/g.127465  ORF Transcript_71446/g.127465 Transcript_71446/m.127465 type:complete len:228 (+) Transcript_71446:1-684(+)
MAAPIQLVYAPIAGRGELARMIIATGEIEGATELCEMANFGTPELNTGESKKEYVSPSGMPLLSHGDLKMSQSGAIESYLASIAPRYSGLTAQQRGIDMMYSGIKEELLFNCAKAIFTTKKTDEEQAKKDVNALFDKWFAIFEEKVPDSGFIQGLDFPTVADLALLNITTGFMPFGAASKLVGGYDFGKFPKVKALCDRTAADEKLASFLSGGHAIKCQKDQNPFGF